MAGPASHLLYLFIGDVAAQKFMANDQKKAQGSAEGKKDYGWLDKAMEAKNYEIIDDVYRP